MADGWITIADKPLGRKLGYQGVNQILQQIRSLAASRPLYWGGYREFGVQPITGALTVNIPNWLDFELDGDLLAGFTVRARVEVRTDDAGTSVTPLIVRADTLATIVTGSACTATALDYSGANQKQTLAITLVGGSSIPYRVQLTGGNGNAKIYGIAHLEIFAP